MSLRLKRLAVALAALVLAPHMPAQSPPPPLISSDVEHFWQAYDAVQQTSDLTLQADALNRLFFGRGTAGLRAFMEAKGYTPAQYLEAIHKYPKFWASVRPRTALAQDKVAAFGPMIENSGPCIRVCAPPRFILRSAASDQAVPR